jgi:spore germination protein
MRFLAPLGMTVVVLALMSGPRPAAAQQPRLMLGYYVPYDATSWQSLVQHADALDIVAAQWVGIDACGNISSTDDQTLKQLAQARNLQVVPSLFTLSGWLNHQLLTDDDTSAHSIEQIVAYVLAEDYDGFDLDLEGIEAADRDAYSAFVARLADALHSQGKLLTLAIPAKDRDVTVGWAGAYDYAALGLAADLVTVMAYEYSGPFSGPGSVAPYPWVDRVARFSGQQIGAEKVLLGLAFYGYDWNVTSGGAESLSYSQAVALADGTAAQPSFDPTSQSVTFSYEALAGARPPAAQRPAALQHVITRRAAAACELVPPAATPIPPRPAPVPGTPQQHEVWLEDSTSVLARIGLAERYQVAGIATWRLGLEDPAVWSAIAEYRNGHDR